MLGFVLFDRFTRGRNKIMIMVIDTSMREHAISTHNKTDLEVKENYMYPIS